MMKKAKKNDRFVKIYEQGQISGARILVDKETGVNYLFAFEGYAGGMTVLVDREGKPVITPITSLEEID